MTIKPNPGETLAAYIVRLARDHGLDVLDESAVSEATRDHLTANAAPRGYEQRHFAGALELRQDDQGHDTIHGHAAVFESLSLDLGGFQEKIDRRAFRATLRDQDDVRALWNHEPGLVLGRTESGTLKLSVDQRGLVFEIDPPATSWARDHLETMRRGDVSQASFGFIARKDDWQEGDDGELPTRTLLDVQLLDVSPVTYPAYTATDTEVAQRSLNTWQRARNLEPPGSSTRNRERWNLQRLAEEKDGNGVTR